SRANCSTSISIFMCHSLSKYNFTRLTRNYERSPNKRIHQTTLQTPFALLAEERYHLSPLSKPYMGIHPKAVNVILAKNSNIDRAVEKTRGIYIPNRDMQSYDAFIPSFTALVALSYAGYSMHGGILWK
ncbi:MAG: hypothetical protein WBK95_03925, partial [Sulfurimonas sp.]